jgi:hypothetical protein
MNATVNAWRERVFKRLELEAEVRKPRPGETDEEAQLRFWAICRTGPGMASIGFSTIIDNQEGTIRFERPVTGDPQLIIIPKDKEHDKT